MSITPVPAIPSSSNVISFSQIPPTGNAQFCSLSTFGHEWGRDAVWTLGICPEHAAQRIYSGELRLDSGARDEIERYVDNPPRVVGRNSFDLDYLRQVLSADSKWATKPLAQLKLSLESALHQGPQAVAEIGALLVKILNGCHSDESQRDGADDRRTASAPSAEVSR